MTTFPGRVQPYRHDILGSAIGIGGDGVDQDDIVGVSGAHDFLAPVRIRFDELFLRNARLLYAKFPR
jgi:hypothetical protein